MWLGEKAGPVPTAVKWSGARLKVIFLEVSLPHTTTMCSFLAQTGFSDLPELWRLYPSPRFTSIFLCQGEGSKNHTCFSFSLYSVEVIASGWTIFHISEHWHCTWHNGQAGYGTRRGAHNGKQVFMVTQVEAARQRHLPCLQSKPLVGELEFWARKCWEKLKARAKKGGKDCGEPKVCSGLSSQRKTKCKKYRQNIDT